MKKIIIMLLVAFQLLGCQYTKENTIETIEYQNMEQILLDTTFINFNHFKLNGVNNGTIYVDFYQGGSRLETIYSINLTNIGLKELYIGLTDLGVDNGAITYQVAIKELFDRYEYQEVITPNTYIEVSQPLTMKHQAIQIEGIADLAQDYVVLGVYTCNDLIITGIDNLCQTGYITSNIELKNHIQHLDYTYVIYYERGE